MKANTAGMIAMATSAVVTAAIAGTEAYIIAKSFETGMVEGVCAVAGLAAANVVAIEAVTTMYAKASLEAMELI